MNKVLFSDFTLQNSQLFKWRYINSIWVRTKSYLWQNNGEQPEVTSPEATWPEVGSPEVCSTHAQPEVSQYTLVGPFHRKWRQWPEVIVCACATGTFCFTTRVVVQVPWLPVTEGVEGCAHAQPEVAQYPPSGAFSPEVGYRKWRHFPAHFSW